MLYFYRYDSLFKLSHSMYRKASLSIWIYFDPTKPFADLKIVSLIYWFKALHLLTTLQDSVRSVGMSNIWSHYFASNGTKLTLIDLNGQIYILPQWFKWLRGFNIDKERRVVKNQFGNKFWATSVNCRALGRNLEDLATVI